MTNVILSTVQQFILEGYKKHAGTEGLVCDELDKLLRLEDPEGLLGPAEKRRCNHACTQLKKLGLIERCGTIGDGPTKTGLYRAAIPKTAEEEAAEAEAAAAKVIPFPATKRGVILRVGEMSVECDPDATPEFVADLARRLGALR